MRDHPIVENMERTGYPDRKIHKVPICPICHEQCETVYTDTEENIVGCDNCLDTHDAWEIESIQQPE